MKSHQGFQVLRDRTPKYTVKEVAEIMELSTYTIRYYDNSGLIPGVDRSDGNIRLFSDYNVSWLKLVHCLRATGLSVEGVKHYIDMCQKGDSTIPERAELIFQQEKILREQLKTLQTQMEVLKYKKNYYKNLLATGQNDRCNPKNPPEILVEPEIAPQE
ncbi:MAG: MerR family transcriptional regulator [Lentisphaeria bacterium]|nr:MerR family transcriptional regulator [Lentisphaeria bacterium]